MLAQLGYLVYAWLSSLGLFHCSEYSDETVASNNISIGILIGTCVCAVANRYITASLRRADQGMRLHGFVALDFVTVVLVIALNMGMSYAWPHVVRAGTILGPKLMDQWGTAPFAVYLAGLVLLVSAWGTVACYCLLALTSVGRHLAPWIWAGVLLVLVAIAASIVGVMAGNTMLPTRYWPHSLALLSAGVVSYALVAIGLGIAQVYRRREYAAGRVV